MIVVSVNEHCSKTNPEIQRAFFSQGVTFAKNRAGKFQASVNRATKSCEKSDISSSHPGRHNTLVYAHRKYLLELNHTQPFPRSTLTKHRLLGRLNETKSIILALTARRVQ